MRIKISFPHDEDSRLQFLIALDCASLINSIKIEHKLIGLFHRVIEQANCKRLCRVKLQTDLMPPQRT